MQFINALEIEGMPNVVWISGFFSPHSFLTAVLEDFSIKVPLYF